MEDAVSRGLTVAKQLLPQAPWPAPEIAQDDLPKPKKSRTGPLGKADIMVAEAPAWLRVYDNAPWVNTPEYRNRIDGEKSWPLYDLILTTPTIEHVNQVITMLVEAINIEESDAQRFAIVAVGNPLPLLIGVPKEAAEAVRRKLSAVARVDVLRSVWDRL
ncbi:MAG: hypothetical protein HY692_02145 [Cyanobacteria bacterium NC_groundwater_1444_Ag_S-0.65um_54_12]|nr:hypothetical protein [Cyanobacteria bacterium NC_groundwater_1444_Ag_S-0.65um_54_12]